MQKLPWVLLAISIIFNFTFAGGFLHARSGYEAIQAPEAGTKMVADEFNLTEAQRKVFSNLRQEAQTRAKELRQSLLLARQELWSEMSCDQPDPQRIGEIQDRLAELYWEYRRQSSEHLRQFLAVLNSQQREAVMQKIRERERSHYWGRRFLERFDTNSDGKLDESERSRARQQFTGRHGRPRWPYPSRTPPWGRPPGSRFRHERGGPSTRPAPASRWPGGPQKWPPRRPDAKAGGTLGGAERPRTRQATQALPGQRRPPQWMLDRFDADGDGKLSPQEREAAMRAARDTELKNIGPNDPDRTASPPQRGRG